MAHADGMPRHLTEGLTQNVLHIFATKSPLYYDLVASVGYYSVDASR